MWGRRETSSAQLDYRLPVGIHRTLPTHSQSVIAATTLVFSTAPSLLSTMAKLSYLLTLLVAALVAISGSAFAPQPTLCEFSNDD